MAINFSNCSVLSYNSQNVFFGNNISRYKTVKNLSIKGIVGDLFNWSGVKPVVSGISELLQSSVDFQPIILNSYNFGNGKITSWNFSEGQDHWVRESEFTCEVEIFESGNLEALTGAFYGNFGQLLAEPAVGIQFLDSMEENFSFNQGKNNLIEAEHTLNIKFISGDDNTSPITKARYLAAQIFSSGTLDYSPSGALLATGLLFTLYFPSGLVTGDIIPNKRYFNESYNLVDYSCNFSEKYYYDPTTNKNWFVEVAHSCQTDENGITNLTENGSIKGLVIPTWAAAISGYNEQQVNIFDRCNSVFTSYVGTGGYLLINQPIQQGSTFNKFAGTLDYSYQFTNNPMMNSGYSWIYNITVDVNNEIVTVSEQDTIVGMGKINTAAKYNNAVSGFNIVSTGILSRISGAYSGAISPTKNLKKISANSENSPYKGTVGATNTYSDDPSLIFNGAINKKNVVVNDTKPSFIWGDFFIAGTEATQGRELLQNGSNTNLGAKNINITYNYDRSLGQSAASTLFSLFKTDVNNLTSSLPTDHFTSECNFSIEETSNTFQGNATVQYVETKNPDSISLGWP